MLHRLILVTFSSLLFWVGSIGFVVAERDSVINTQPKLLELEHAVRAGRAGLKFPFSGVHVCANHDRFEVLRNTLQVSGDTSSVAGCILVPEPAYAIVLVKKYLVVESKGCVWDVEVIGDLDPSTKMIATDTETGITKDITDGISMFLRAQMAECEEGEA